MHPHWLVFTDLDGTLLDHDTYDYSPALPAINRLKDRAIPIIPVSSKTLAELDELVTGLDLHGPVIAENGTIIRFPGEQPNITPPGYQAIRNLMQEWRKDPNNLFTGFGDMTVDEVVQATGLSSNAAHRAMQRLASEPILWQGSEQALGNFRQLVESAELQMLQGGRFISLQGDMDKGRAIQRVVDWYRNHGLHDIVSLGLGDSANDVQMLLKVDIPVIISKKDGSHLDLPHRKDAIVTELPGPDGWNQTLNNLLNEHGRQ